MVRFEEIVRALPAGGRPRRGVVSGPETAGTMGSASTMGPAVREAGPRAVTRPRLAAARTEIREQLARLRPGRHYVVSCYVSLTPEERQGKRYWVQLKDALKAAEELPGRRLSPAARMAVSRDVRRILERFRDPAVLPRANGFAVFACGPLGLLETVSLPRVLRTRARIAHTPDLEEFLAAEREFGRVTAVVFDRTRARFFEVTAFGAEEREGLRSSAMRGGKFHGDRKDAPGWGERDYHTRIREEKHRHYDAIARRLLELDRHGAGVLLLGPGTAPVVLERFLAPVLARRVIGTARLNPREATAAKVYEATLAAREPHERAAQSALVSAMEGSLGRRWSVHGMRATLRALAKGQVRVLLVRVDAQARGFRCAGSGRLVLTPGDCRAEGEPLPVPDLVQAAMQEAHRQGVAVVLIHAPEAAERLSGMGALLRFR